MRADACASYYPPHEQLVGAHSRDYDFVSGNGATNFLFDVQGYLR